MAKAGKEKEKVETLQWRGKAVFVRTLGISENGPQDEHLGSPPSQLVYAGA